MLVSDEPVPVVVSDGVPFEESGLGRAPPGRVCTDARGALVRKESLGGVYVKISTDAGSNKQKKTRTRLLADVLQMSLTSDRDGSSKLSCRGNIFVRRLYHPRTEETAKHNNH